jgi:hypothetical protein
VIFPDQYYLVSRIAEKISKNPELAKSFYELSAGPLEPLDKDFVNENGIVVDTGIYI